jgi:hypothetical protein
MSRIAYIIQKVCFTQAKMGVCASILVAQTFLPALVAQTSLSALVGQTFLSASSLQPAHLDLRTRHDPHRRTKTENRFGLRRRLS